MTDLATAMTGSVAADGQTPMTGALNMNSNKISSLADGTLSADATTLSQVNTAIATAGATYLLKASNLSDVANATTARGNLTAAKSGANSDITSLTGLTTPLTVAQGGTGAATLTANNVLLGNGTSAPQFVAPSTTGNVLTSNGTTWVSSTPTAVNTSQLAKAWVNFDGGTGTIRGSYNVSSVTVVSSGTYTLNFITAMPNGNYAVVGIGEFTNGITPNGIVTVNGSNLPTTTSATIQCLAANGTAAPGTYIAAVVFSS
jgi:hypothetical protein